MITLAAPGRTDEPPSSLSELRAALDSEYVRGSAFRRACRAQRERSRAQRERSRAQREQSRAQRARAIPLRWRARQLRFDRW
ncbi:MAG: hypothetical protein J2P59_02160, partial [Acidimicrobiales bacterium]|nr:hypothetical protein [Acidimicrobiales bacterium]